MVNELRERIRDLGDRGACKGKAYDGGDGAIHCAVGFDADATALLGFLDLKLHGDLDGWRIDRCGG